MLFCRVMLSRFVQNSILVWFLSSFFVRVLLIQPYNSTDTALTWNNSRFIDRMDQISIWSITCQYHSQCLCLRHFQQQASKQKRFSSAKQTDTTYVFYSKLLPKVTQNSLESVRISEFLSSENFRVMVISVLNLLYEIYIYIATEIPPTF